MCRPQTQASQSWSQSLLRSYLSKFVLWKLLLFEVWKGRYAEIILIFIELLVYARLCLSSLPMSVHLILKALRGRLTCSLMRKLSPERWITSPKGSELDNSSCGVGIQTGWLQKPSCQLPPQTIPAAFCEATTHRRREGRHSQDPSGLAGAWAFFSMEGTRPAGEQHWWSLKGQPLLPCDFHISWSMYNSARGQPRQVFSLRGNRKRRLTC